MTKRIVKSMTFWVISLGALGYISALLFGDESWISASEPPLFYEIVVMIKVLFIKLLRLLVAPVVFISLIAGIISIGNLSRLKQMGKITILYYLGTTCIAVILGLTVVFFVHPWEGGVTLSDAGTLVQQTEGAAQNARFIDPQSGSLVKVAQQLLEKAFVNPISALAELNILGIVFNAIVIGLAIVLVVPESSPLIGMIQHINRVMTRMISWVFRITPIGVFAIIFDFTLRIGGHILDQLFLFSITVLGITLIHALLVLPGIAYLFSGITPWQLLRKIAYPMTVAFSTASSSATLPVTLKACQDNLKVSKPVSSFVLPLGATMNMDGTALFEGIAAVFLAYLFGIDLSSSAIVAIFVMAMVSSVGAPGMPSGSMAGMQMVLLAAGIPLEAIAVLMVVERPLDTFRTAVNVEGDMIGALVVQGVVERSDLRAGEQVADEKA